MSYFLSDAICCRFRWLAVVALLVSPGLALAEETIMFPSRASDLPADSYWNMAGDHGGSNSRDLNVARPAGSGWTATDANGGSENTDHLIFGLPLYAPADGEVVSCWRKHPENPRPGVPHPGRCCGDNCDLSCDHRDCPSSTACTVTRSGNHMAIQKDDGDLVVLAHMQSNSIPASLCPNGAVFMSNSRNRSGDFPAESFLRKCQADESPQADDCFTSRPKVKQGEFIGRAGNSGASSGPHLHLHTVRVTNNNGILVKNGPIRPTDVNYGWLKHRTDDSVWKPFRADTIRNPKVIIQASPYLRRAKASAGAVEQTDTLFLSSNRAVTASVAESNHNLKLITWDLVGLSAIQRKGQAELGATQSVRLSEPTGNFVLVAVHQADGLLKMIAFQVGPTGNLLRRATHTAGQISALDMATTSGPNRRSVTAVRDDDGNLKLIAWDIAIDNDGTVRIVRLAQRTAGAVSALSVVRARNFTGVFAAVRDSQGKLLVIPWRLSANGGSWTRGDDAEAGEIGSHVDVAALSQGVAVAVRDGDGVLRITTWSASSSGDIGQRRGTRVAGEVSQVRLLTSPHGGSNLTTVVRSAEGELLLIGWRVDADGRNLRRLGSSKAGTASHLSADVVSRSYTDGPRDMILTALRATNGDLKLITWDTNLANP